MKFSVGYPNYYTSAFYELLAPYRDSISEVYFAWPGIASGRAEESHSEAFADTLKYELRKFKNANIKLNLLLNGNCYGDKAISRALAKQTIDTVALLRDEILLDSVTTASPYLAETVKKFFSGIDVRASVNMWIDGVPAMEQCKDIFDSFYMKREYNRSPDEIAKQRDWCHNNGKKLYMLANSGCIAHCPYHTFHDNFIAHSKNIEDIDMGYSPYNCRKLLKREENRYLILAGNLVRPEDIHNYEGLVDGVKLATRIHPYPITVIGAYVRERFIGDLCGLTEPGFGDLLGGYILDNSAIPDDFWQRVTSCGHECHSCGYCEAVYKRILCKIEAE